MPPPIPTTVDAALHSIAPISAELDSLDTRLCATITRVEDLLRNHLSTRVSLDVGEYVVSFGKLNGRWQLAVGDEPLTNCHRHVRAEVFASGHVKALICSASSQLDDQVALRCRAIAAAEAIADALGGRDS